MIYQHKPNYPADVLGKKFYFLCLFAIHIIGPSNPWVPHSWIQSIMDQRYLGGKNSRKFQKVKHEFATHHQLFTKHLYFIRDCK